MQAQLFLNALNATDENKHYVRSSLIRKCWEIKLTAILRGELSSENTTGVCKHITQRLCSSAHCILFCLFKHTDTLFPDKANQQFPHIRNKHCFVHTASAHDRVSSR